MKLQRCHPSFFDARDAIIQADQILTGGENLCELWKGFSERGLGPDATLEGSTPWGGGIRTNVNHSPLHYESGHFANGCLQDYDVPLICKEEKVSAVTEILEDELSIIFG